MLEGVLLHIFRGIKGKLLSNASPSLKALLASLSSPLMKNTQNIALPRSNSSVPFILPRSFSSPNLERKCA